MTWSFFLFWAACRWRFKRWDRGRIEAYQTARARAMVRLAMRQSAHFRERFAGCDLDRVWNLPTTDKRRVMGDFSRANTLGFDRKECEDFCLQVEGSRDFSRRFKGVNVAMSSGTSGNKLIVLTTPREEKYLKAALFARFDFPPRQKLNVAFLLRVFTPAFNLNLLGHRLTFVDLLQPLDSMCAQLDKLQPNVLSGPPSILRLLALAQRGGRLRIKPGRVVSYAEVLYPDVRALVEDTFGGPLHEIYQCSEGPIAISCGRGSLHINEDLVAVQLENEDGTPTPPGETCRRLVVTDLHKTSQPIIRYELNDLVALDPKPCACGSAFRVIARVQGRADDLLWARGLNGGFQYIFPDYLSRAIISASGAVEDYQVVQESPDRLRVRLTLPRGGEGLEGIKDGLTSAIRRIFQQYGCVAPDIRCEMAEGLLPRDGGKLRRIIRAFQPEEAA